MRQVLCTPDDHQPRETAELIKQAKIYAAQNDTTVNSLVRKLLQDKLNGDARARTAAERLLAIAEGGPYFTTDLASIGREELHER